MIYKILIGLVVACALVYCLLPLATEPPSEAPGLVLEISFLVNPEMLGIPDLILESERESLAAHSKK